MGKKRKEEVEIKKEEAEKAKEGIDKKKSKSRQLEIARSKVIGAVSRGQHATDVQIDLYQDWRAENGYKPASRAAIDKLVSAGNKPVQQKITVEKPKEVIKEKITELSAEEQAMTDIEKEGGLSLHERTVNLEHDRS